MLSYDPKKRVEYIFRLCLSLLVFIFITFAAWGKGLSDPALWELLLIGYGFCIISTVHSCWALLQIAKQHKSQNE